MIESIIGKLAIYGAKKFVEAKLGDGVSVDDEFDTAGAVADILGENKKDIVGFLDNQAKRIKRNNFEQTAETAAEDFMNALDAKDMTQRIQNCHHGRDDAQEAQSFAVECWTSMSKWRNDNLSAGIESETEKLCMEALQKIFCAIVKSELYQSNTTKRIEEKVDAILEQRESAKAPTPPHLLTKEGPIEVKCWFRDDELNDIKTQLNTQQHLMLVSGFGGIGKSTVARQLFHDIHKHYAFAGWVPYTGNLRSSLFQSFRDAEGFPWARVEDMALRSGMIWDFLQDSKKRILLIIDNVEQDESADPDLDQLTGMEHLTVILTSRLEALAKYEPFPIGFMSKEKSAELFISYYKATGRRYRDSDRKTVEQLVELVQCHTFSVELLAKSAKREPTLKSFYEQMKEIGIQYPKLSVNAGAENARRTMAEHLKKLFDWTQRSEEEARVLQNLALMPSVVIPTEVSEWIQCEEDTLNALTESGWLRFQDEEDFAGYYLHPLVKDVLLLDREKFLDGIGAEFMLCLIQKKYIASGKETYVTALPKLAIADSVLEGIGIQQSKVYARACNNLARLFKDFGDYAAAQRWFEQAKVVGEAVFDAENSFLGTIYNNFAGLYRLQGSYSQAETYYLKALAIYEKVLGMDHSSTATIYNNLALLYKAQGNYSKAEEFYLKDLAIYEKVLGMDHPSTATTYNNLALLYQVQGNYSEAEKFYLKALAVKEATIGKDHPSTATTYNNLAKLYKDRGNYSEAEKFYLKALAIRENVLGMDHPSTAVTYHNLGNFYAEQGKTDEGLGYFLLALRVWLSKKHFYVKETLAGIFHHYSQSSYAQTQESPLEWLIDNLSKEEMMGVMVALMEMMSSDDSTPST